VSAERKSPLGLIEEAIQLLRASPVTVYALYCAGTIPFLLTFFNFCAEMSYSRNAGDNCAGSAVAVALTYCWMKGFQAFCCRELVRVYTGQGTRWWRPGTMLAIWSRQIAFQPFGFFIKPLAWLLIFPVTYVSGFFQILTILAGSEGNDVKKSWKLARLWPKQSYSVYGLLSLLALIVFFDLYAVIFSVPFLLKLLLGIESFMTRSYAWAFSPILLIALAAIAYFLIDLLAKAIEVVRCCDGESLETGGDLLRRLAAWDSKESLHLHQTPERVLPDLPNPTGTRRGPCAYGFRFLCLALVVAMPLFSLSASVTSANLRSESPDQRLTQSQLDRQIERTLHNPEFSWRERSVSTGIRHQSIVERWTASLRQLLASLGHWVSQLLKSLLKSFDLKAPNGLADAPKAWLSSSLFKMLGALLWLAFAGTLIIFMLRLLKLKPAKLPLSVAPASKPDLADEVIEANQLPDNEWYALAREKMSAGEFRQAQRALFLAILSYLAAHRFITVERWKSNIDYERELGRKAKHLSELPLLFTRSRLGFESCWYGAAIVTSEDCDNYNDIYQKIKHAAA
jgi:hypothetical protein